MDDMVYLKFVDENIGNGVFAKNDLEPNTILGHYTGVICYYPES